MKSLMTRTSRVPMALLVTLAAGGCTPNCGCEIDFSCPDGRICDVGANCKPDEEKGLLGLCVDPFPDEFPGGTQTTPP